MQAPVLWSGPDLVNTTTTGDQYNSTVMSLAGGGYVVSWSGQLAPPINSDKTYFQVFDASGTKVGGQTIADTPSNSTDPQIASLSGGGFVIAQYSYDSGSWGVYAQIFDEMGSPLTPNAFVASTEDDPVQPEDQRSPHITGLSDGGFAITYIVDETDGTRSIRLRLFEADGTPDGAEIYVAFDPEGTVDNLTIQRSGGVLAVAWQAGMVGDRDVVMQLFDEDGTPKTGIVPITDGSASQFRPEIAADGTGNFLVTYHIETDSEVRAQLFAADGALIKPQFLISDIAQNEAASGQFAKAIGLAAGGYLVVWREWDGTKAQLVGQVLDAEGAKVGAETMIYDGLTNGDTFRPSDMTLLGDGRVVVTIDGTFGSGGDTDAYSVHTVIVDVRGGIIEGTDQDDFLSGSIGIVADTITAKDGNDALYGFDGDDTLYGNEGNDTLEGGPGADSLVGGSGDDFYFVDLADTIVEAAGGGWDTVFVEGFDYTLAGGAEIEVLETWGGGDHDLTGNEFGQLLVGDESNNKLIGMGGNDTLDGGASVDYMEGGEGDDCYIADNAADFIVEAANGGNDTVKSAVTFSLEFRDNVENLTLKGSDGIDGTGNALANVLTGNDNDNELFGLAGNDTLIGMGGADTLHGGAGDDTYDVANAGDVVVEKLGEGTDTVNAFINYTLTANVEKLNLMGSVAMGTGNGLANTLLGNGAGNTLTGLDGNDTLDGQGGNDTMAGGRHDDTYVVAQAGDVVTEAADEGYDTVIASLSYALTANVEALSLVAGTTATGNGLANVITGNAGTNTIDGKGGADTMTGLAGDDTYVVGDAGDVVVEAAGGGYDTVIAHVDHTLAANVEKLVLAAGKLGKGNGLANTLVGNDAANTLKGGDGNDTLKGGGGKDLLKGGKGDDTYLLGKSTDIVSDSGGTDDTIVSTSSRKLASFTGIENLTLDGTGNLNGTGNDAANDLIGNAGNNQLKGKAGDDLLSGGLGTDRLWGGDGNDRFDFNSIAEIGKSSKTRDIIEDFEHLSDRIDLKSIDAKSLVSGNNKFKFVAAEGTKFSGVAGELIWDQKNRAGTSNDVTLVSGDINGDKIADFTLELTGLVELTKGDFIL